MPNGMGYGDAEIEILNRSCEECGATISDRPLHNKWHERINNIAEQANSWTPPPKIGVIK